MPDHDHLFPTDHPLQYQSLVPPAAPPFDGETLDKYADVLIWGLQIARRTPLRKSELVLVRYDAPALPLAEAVVCRLHEKGCIPVLRAGPTPRMAHTLYAQANNKRITYQTPGERELYMELGGAINCIAPASLTHLEDIDPDLINKAVRARKPLQDILHKREALGEYSWTLGYYPTPALAEHAGLSVEAYAQQIRKACHLDAGQPVQEWKKLQKRIVAVRDRLNALDVRSLRVTSDAFDLYMEVGDKRRWVGLTGRNIPSFELYVSPDWRTVDGTYRATMPSYRSGNRVEGLTLTFRRGQVAKYQADKGENFVAEQLATDRGARRIGEFALVDKGFSRIDRFMANTLFDENHGGEHGSCHIALGNSYANTFSGDQALLDTDAKEALGFNVSSLHWDLVNTAPVTVQAVLGDGSKRTIFENGSFTVDGE